MNVTGWRVVASGAAAALLVPAGPAAATDPADQAARLFTQKCAACHAAGGWGTRTLARRGPADQAELRSRKGLDPAHVRFVVRRGIGSMPQFTPTDLSDDQLRFLGEWLAKSTIVPSATHPNP